MSFLFITSIKKYKMNQKTIGAGLAIILLMLTIFTIPSCKKYADPSPYFEDTLATVKPLVRKVLIIGVDGAVGAEYKIIQPSVLVGLQAHSKYSWDAVSDESTTDADYDLEDDLDFSDDDGNQDGR